MYLNDQQSSKGQYLEYIEYKIIEKQTNIDKKTYKLQDNSPVLQSNQATIQIFLLLLPTCYHIFIYSHCPKFISIGILQVAMLSQSHKQLEMLKRTTMGL
jgi:hypothetical protein